MRKALGLMAGLVAAALVAGPAASQDRSGGKKPACDVKQVEPAMWCEKCDKILEKDDIKDGKCAKEECGTKAKKIELCVKKCYVASCHPDKQLKAGGS